LNEGEDATRRHTLFWTDGVAASKFECAVKTCKFSTTIIVLYKQIIVSDVCLIKVSWIHLIMC